jgi:hypothetical protein
MTRNSRYMPFPIEEAADSARGKPLPPTERPGDTWSLVRPVHHKSSKR